MARSSRIAVLLIAGLAALGTQRLTHAQDVTIYRCVDAKGHLTLRDTPCAKDQKQEARTMTRPQDAPRKSTRPAATEAPPTRDVADTQVASRETYLAPPRPLYECITPDGMAYTSDTSDGNPRWVPLWTLGYPSRGLIGSNFSGPTFIGPNTYGAGTYVRDTCYMLPPADVCARTRDRRDEIRKRFFNAQPSERDVLRVEERSLNARLDNDCGGQ
ncbi:DUF4124 domain-containing protein [Noviluteimonas gilva]|uniref:DUF4124 domain-containing protein n=1 Tax=Noviluteimonas gilva TaxID=2682097 RepID=A0A7C9LGM9_9GAMM|nr:DUF4124 domain-containing protein [Lysobacter gilvus]MUV13320.1 DUF4124 domain-containing protein [Lysobacter gilvus]